MSPQRDLREALELLGKQRLVLAIHDASFPSAPGEDTGRGSPYTNGGRDFIRFASELGFDGLQLGPQGQTSRFNPSPYDSTLFSRNQLSVNLHELAEREWLGLLSVADLQELVARNPARGATRVQLDFVHTAYDVALRRAFDRLSARRAEGDASAGVLAAELEVFRRANQSWLESDALYAILEAENDGQAWPHWDRSGSARHDWELFCPPPGAEAWCLRRREALARRHERALERYAFIQFVLHSQHAAFRTLANEMGLRLYGDLQIGMSRGDVWRWRSDFLEGYLMGAPPSRTNVEGQAWGYPVLDPGQYRTASGSPGPVLELFDRRFEKMLAEFDGLRLDHPHGLICPWVYRSDVSDALKAVQSGARLFSSPDLPDHPGLRQYAIVTRAQLSPDSSTPRHGDDWVRELTEEQVARYATLLDAIVAEMDHHGHPVTDLVCEVLSTQPYPLERVMERQGLGRFRVTQKANLDDPNNIYRSENAQPRDWIMVGTHDTAPIWHLAGQWHGTEVADRQAVYLAERLRHAVRADELAANPAKLVHAKVADVFASRAQNVMIFFTDLLGIEETFNRPGTVSEDNWTLRVGPDYAARYSADVRKGRALNLPRVLALALRARGLDRHNPALLERLEQQAAWWPTS